MATSEAPQTRKIRVSALDAAILLLLLAFAFLRSHTITRPGPINDYWAFHWEIDYSLGFTRRGLLGQAMRMIGTHPHDFLLYDRMGALISLLLAYFVARRALAVFGSTPTMCSVIVAGAIAWSMNVSGVIYDKSGDPLQLLLLSYLLIWPVILNREYDSTWSWVIALLIGGIGFLFSLVHEAHIFFTLGPCVALLWFAKLSGPGARRNASGWILGSIIGVIAVAIWGQGDAGWQARATHQFMLNHADKVVHYSPDIFPPFRTLLHQMFVLTFGPSPGASQYLIGILRRLGELCCVFIPPAVQLMLIRNLSTPESIGRSHFDRRVPLTLLGLSALALPLFVIGTDWGRFACYLFILTLFLAVSGTSQVPLVPISFGRASSRFKIGVVVTLVGTAVGVAIQLTEENGYPKALFFPAAALMLIGTALTTRDRPLPADTQTA